MDSPQTLTGSCLCGGVRYRVTGPLRPIIACHCSQCRKTSGSYVLATSCPLERFELISDETLSWYRASETAERGFCSRCGGNLFWKADGEDRISLFAGCLDGETGLEIAAQWYVSDKSDFVKIDPDLPQGP
ncbi:MAG: GFA family protein [Pseudomonadota bacterium]